MHALVPWQNGCASDAAPVEVECGQWGSKGANLLSIPLHPAASGIPKDVFFCTRGCADTSQSV
eukprot:538659-Amphidinium_carterae.1